MDEREDRAAEFHIVLAGPPNAGKSSLFNALVRQFGSANATPALVSEAAGTTRDYLVAPLSLGGRRCDLVDTAGVRIDAHWDEERPSVDLASRRAADGERRAADLVLECVDAAAGDTGSRNPPSDANRGSARSQWLVLTKADLADPASLDELRRQWQPAAVTSSCTGQGLDELVREIASAAAERAETSGSAVAATAARCRESLIAASQCLASARRHASATAEEELVAAELRDALHEIGLVVGAVYTDDILDRIFSRFCIGK
jgi:tRNA modification GTPase